MISTFICEWDSDNLPTLVVAAETLRMKAIELRKIAARKALELVDCEEGEA